MVDVLATKNMRGEMKGECINVVEKRPLQNVVASFFSKTVDKKNAFKFNCQKCEFHSNNRYNFNQHLLTPKHKRKKKEKERKKERQQKRKKTKVKKKRSS